MGTATKSVYRDLEKFTLTFDGAADTQYVMFLLNSSTEETLTKPSATNVRYIDQTAATEVAAEDGGTSTYSVDFTLYPDDISATGEYGVYVSSSGASGTYTEIATFQVTAYYTLGDINADDDINSVDALLALRFSVRNIDLDETQQKAANVNGDSSINSADALQILRYSVGNITEFG